MDNGKKRGVLVWHRRGGKDKTALNFTIKRMFPKLGGRIGTYFHLFPTYAQGKKILWDGIDATGMPVLDHFPSELVASRNETELQIVLKCGSIWQIIGTDKMNSIVGTNPVGCVFSEYALQNPSAWNLIRPILRENGGWAMFAYTPRGRNHGRNLYDMAKGNSDWFCEKLTVNDTYREDGTPVISLEDIAADRAEGMDEELIQQEYYCSFEGYQQGSYYARELKAAEEEDRIGNVPWEPLLPVITFWDIGIGDKTAIWFMQRAGKELRFIDYYENSGEGVAHYAKVLSERPYKYFRHYWPHDGKNREFSTGDKRRDTAEALGIRPIDLVVRGMIDQGIETVRNKLSRCWFDRKKCEDGLNALASYHKEYDDDRKEFKDKPYHDWSSDGSDAFRTFAMSDGDTIEMDRGSRLTVLTGFDPMNIQDVQVVSDFHV